MRDGTAAPLTADACVDLLSCFNKLLKFRHACTLGAEVIRHHRGDPRIHRRYAQALINTGALAIATQQLGAGLAIATCPQNERAELEGLHGRILKQRYVDSVAQGRPDTNLLTQATDQYLGAYDRSRQVWHAINAIALLCRADQDAVVHPRAGEVQQLAQRWMDTLSDKYDDGRADA